MEAESVGPALSLPKDKLILIVDDDDTVRGFLELAAQTEGFTVVTAANGLEAAKSVEGRTPDLIITDLMMPGQGGYEFLRNLQGSGQGRIPVFVISASRMDDSTVQMIRQEANVLEFIPKPVPMAAFCARLHQVLGTVPPEVARSRGINDRARSGPGSAG